MWYKQVLQDVTRTWACVEFAVCKHLREHRVRMTLVTPASTVVSDEDVQDKFEPPPTPDWWLDAIMTYCNDVKENFLQVYCYFLTIKPI